MIDKLGNILIFALNLTVVAVIMGLFYGALALIIKLLGG